MSVVTWCGRVGLGLALVTSAFVPVASAGAAEQGSVDVGSFGMGGGFEGRIDERLGSYSTGVPLAELPGANGDGVSIGLGYSQDLARGGSDVDRFGFGVGWMVDGVGFVDLEGGEPRVFVPSNGFFAADESSPSGLRGYLEKNVLFRQGTGTLPARAGIMSATYRFVMHELGGRATYFNAAGDVVAVVDAHGNRTDWVWDENQAHRLTRVVDSAGNSAEVVWTESGVEVLSPRDADGTQARSVVESREGFVNRVVLPGDITMELRYVREGAVGAGLLASMALKNGAATDVSYQPVGQGDVAVDRVQVNDPQKGTVLSVHEWSVVGERTASGWPVYGSKEALWESGDGEFRYVTELTDGVSRVLSEFNSQASLLSKQVRGSRDGVDVLLEETAFTYPDTRGGGVAPPALRSSHYAKPEAARSARFDAAGNARELQTSMVFDDFGRTIREVAPDGAVTETVYDDTIPDGSVLPLGGVVEKTETAVDGSVSKTVNTFTPDHRDVAATETFTASPGGSPTRVSRAEFTVEHDGFVSEERVFPVNGSNEPPRVTGFERNTDDRFVTITRTDAKGTGAQSVSRVITDKASGVTMGAVDPTGREKTITYDTAGRVIEEHDFSGRVTATRYEGLNATHVTGPDGVTRSEYRDVLGRVTRTTDNIHDGVATPGFERVAETRRYEANGSRVVSTDAHGAESVAVSDVWGRPIGAISETGVRHVTEYDDVANTTRTGLTTGDLSDALVVTETHKDDRGRDTRVSSVRADGVSVPEQRKEFDGLGRVTETHANDRVTTRLFNDAGLPGETTVSPEQKTLEAGNPVTASRVFDGFGSSTKKTLSNGENSRSGRSRSLDAAGRVSFETDQNGGVTRYTYSPDGLVLTETSESTGRGEVRNSYDALTRSLVRSETIGHSGTVSREFTYDANTGAVASVYDPADREGTEISYRHDAFGNMTETRYPDGITIQHSFDEHGRATSTTDGVGNVTRYGYNNAELLTQARQFSPDGVLLAGVEYTYDEYGRVTKLQRENGSVTEYTFTSSNQVKTEETRQGHAVLSAATYEYDTHDNVTQRTDTDATGVTTITNYTYDMFDRLTRSSTRDVEGNTIEHVAYEFTVSNDVKRKETTRGDRVSVREFTYNDLGHLVDIATNGVEQTQHYDAAGNLTVDMNDTTYAYDLENSVTSESHTDGSRTTMDYWVTGKRKAITTQGEGDDAQITLYWDGNTIINEKHNTSTGSADIWSSYLLGTARHARVITTPGHSVSESNVSHSTEYYVHDRHGSITMMVDDAGMASRSYRYSDYGVVTENEANAVPDLSRANLPRNAFQYSGEYTGSRGEQYLGPRVYQPETTRFTTQDTVSLHNLYGYVDGNPITNVDPTGNFSLEDARQSGLMAGLEAIFGGLAFTAFVGTMSSGARLGGILGIGFSTFAGMSILYSTGLAVAQALTYTGAYEAIPTPELSDKLGFASTVLAGISATSGGVINRLSKSSKYRHLVTADDSVDAYRAAPNAAWDESVQKTSVLAPVRSQASARSTPTTGMRKATGIAPLPDNHYLTKVMRKAPEYGKPDSAAGVPSGIAFRGWALIGKTGTGSNWSLPVVPDLVKIWAYMVDAPAVAARQAILGRLRTFASRLMNPSNYQTAKAEIGLLKGKATPYWYDGSIAATKPRKSLSSSSLDDLSDGDIDGESLQLLGNY